MKKQFSLKSRSSRRLIFYILMMALPILHFCIFYIGINVNAVLLAFKKFDRTVNSYGYVGFKNIMQVFNDLSSDLFITATKNSLTMYFVGLLIGLPLALLFGFYVYKGMPGYKIFKVILFMPSIISSIVMVVMFLYFVELAIPTMINKVFGTQSSTGLLGNASTTFPTLVFYNIWISFGVSMLMYLGAMSGIDISVVESANIDGATGIKEFFHITLPMIYPMLVTFLVVGVAGVFTSQMNLFSFFGPSAEQRLYTFGYYLYKETQKASLTDYPYLAAMGVAFTFIAVPITFGIKYILEKFGPSME